MIHEIFQRIFSAVEVGAVSVDSDRELETYIKGVFNLDDVNATMYVEAWRLYDEEHAA